jgi:hypothetical protein
VSEVCREVVAEAVLITWLEVSRWCLCGGCGGLWRLLLFSALTGVVCVPSRWRLWVGLPAGVAVELPGGDLIAEFRQLFWGCFREQAHLSEDAECRILWFSTDDVYYEVSK